jgi:hypothetical protein
MKRVRIERPKRRRERPWLEVLPLDPRDADVLRANGVGGLREDRGIAMTAATGRRSHR